MADKFDSTEWVFPRRKVGRTNGKKMDVAVTKSTSNERSRYTVMFYEDIENLFTDTGYLIYKIIGGRCYFTKPPENCEGFKLSQQSKASKRKICQFTDSDFDRFLGKGGEREDYYLKYDTDRNLYYIDANA